MNRTNGIQLTAEFCESDLYQPASYFFNLFQSLTNQPLNSWAGKFFYASIFWKILPTAGGN